MALPATKPVRALQRNTAIALSVADDIETSQPARPVLLAVGLVRADGGTQMRAAINPETVAEYAEIMRAGGGWGAFPPARARYDGSDYWLSDGFHRRAAWIQVAGDLAEIPVIVTPGTRRDAILDAAGANADHGLRRTNADKRRAVEILLSDPEWAAAGSGWIAEKCNVSDRFVRAMRAEREPVLSRNDAGIGGGVREVRRGDSVYTMRVQTGPKPPAGGRVHYVQDADAQPDPGDDLPSRTYDDPADLPAVVASDATGSRQHLPALGKCAVCGRPLSDPVHAAAGCGPVCSAKRAAGGADAEPAATNSPTRAAALRDLYLAAFDAVGEYAQITGDATGAADLRVALAGAADRLAVIVMAAE